MHRKRLSIAILTIMALSYSPFTTAEVYTWVDAKGETHFSDKPPESAVSKASKKAQPVQVAEPITEPQSPQAKSVNDLKQTLCHDHRRHLAVLQEKGFEYYYDDKGEPRVAWGVEGFYRQKKRYLSSADAAHKAEAISLEIERYCDNPLDKTLQAKARQDWIRSEYCDVSQVILADLKHPFMRTSEAEIKSQEKEVERFCSEYPANKHRDDGRYYPTSLQVERLQQQHFLYR